MQWKTVPSNFGTYHFMDCYEAAELDGVYVHEIASNVSSKKVYYVYAPCDSSPCGTYTSERKAKKHAEFLTLLHVLGRRGKTDGRI